mmetsp:Transcript_38983/g.70214  ORF Transcript_38983/g.70214 Transcript_38983/m.70214 type:complete len:109 (-) Transcript_38983:1370-1696(-)|eukprot:CAMPEP_0201961922 /NCGR_PEP_ID=MMETSP0904-20121228/8244_1 /ASSEMBLY_ACC=CAM_ASM_000553 /TAXON_ID=420261 /ORGANISM="Thalassiosira antarctica, Strain CCMP982" /LENGTH=108 /DNA_ID=CAMNT_0048508207 /DNA_START=144 /DNA_END=470 /DNA_ORIENTATION=+
MDIHVIKIITEPHDLDTVDSTFKHNYLQSPALLPPVQHPLLLQQVPPLPRAGHGPSLSMQASVGLLVGGGVDNLVGKLVGGGVGTFVGSGVRGFVGKFVGGEVGLFVG